MADYFAKNRAVAQNVDNADFDWSSLGYTEDEIAYLKKHYQENETPNRSSNDWLTRLSKSYTTYTQVKSVFEDLGIDPSTVLNVDNASKVLANPVLSKAVYQKLEKEFGIPAEQSAAFAEKNKHNLEGWAEFVEAKGKVE